MKIVVLSGGLYLGPKNLGHADIGIHRGLDRPALARVENSDKALQEELGIFPSDRLLESEGGSLQLLALRRQLGDRRGTENRKDQESFKKTAF